MPDFNNAQFKADTHKEDGLSIHERIRYTLDGNKEGTLRSVRTTNLLCLLIEKMHTSKILTDDDIDQLLFDIL